MTDGILPDAKIAALAEAGAIRAGRPLDADQIQPASLDLRLGPSAVRVRASFLPGRGHAVSAKLDRFGLHTFSLAGGAVLEVGCVYVVELLERFALPKGVRATANPKSSTGRLDIFTRVLADGGEEFDKVPDGYEGPLFLEISPRTFPILVREGSRLSQIRLRTGRPTLEQAELAGLHAAERLTDAPDASITGGGIALSIDLSGDAQGLVGYRGKRHTAVVDVDKRGAHAILDFWEPLRLGGGGDLVLDPDEFYILVSKEAIHVPPAFAAEMTPFDPLVGEFRVHYAGFFDPGFGNAGAGGAGSRAVLEVRSREVPFILEHGQIVGRLVYERMAALPARLYGSALASNYQAQGLKLSKHFA